MPRGTVTLNVPGRELGPVHVKILLLVSAMHRGGAERVAGTLCNSWAARGDEVTLVATYSGRGECQYPLDERVELVYLADLVPGRRRILGYGSRLRALRRLVRERAPDVVISFLTNVNVTAILATRGLDTPLIVCERVDPGASSDYPVYFKLLCRLLYPLADMVTVQTEAAARALRLVVPRAKRLEVIPNPIPEELLSLRRVALPPGARRRILGMGRLSEQKQLHHLIAAFAELAPGHPDVDLWIWGEGELGPDLQQRARDAGLEHRVFLPGRTDNPWEEMALGEMLVLTSSYEGFPNVMLEAMALGLPCIAYDCPSGPRELSENGQVAVLVRLNDREGLRTEIARLLRARELGERLGAQAAASVRRRYRLESVLAEWDRLIRAASSNRKAPLARLEGRA